MIKATAKVITKSDRLPQLQRAMSDLAGTQVLVGIPEQNAARGGDVTDAQLAWIHTHGVRGKDMASAMDQMMMGPDGVPYTMAYDKMMTEMGQGMPYSEAYEMYIHEHGSAAWRIPPRPIIEPAIEDPENLDAITAQMKEAATAAMDGGPAAGQAGLKRVGMVAEDAVRMWFLNPKNRWPALSPKTIKRKGSDRPLIDTGRLRRAITYVLRKRGGSSV